MKVPVMKKAVILAGGVVAAFVAGYLLHVLTTPTQPPGETDTKAAAGSATGTPEEKPQVWTCSMHPQVRSDTPGKCPICGMTLVPLTQSEAAGPRTFVTTDAAKALMDVEVVPVVRKFVTADVRMVGKVTYDETRLGYITAWVPGRLDRLFIDYTGVPVKKGDHMVLLYSPQLLTAQTELLQSKLAVKDLERSRLDIIRENAQATLEAAREKLRLWGLTPEQIADIEKRGKPIDHMQIVAPMGGIVIHKNAQQGMYVDVGTRIYTIADLSVVWVKLDAYESDLKWVRYGQKVLFSTEAYPGETFIGTIAFIDPVVDPKTRTVKVRVNVPNANGKLKPDMFVRGIVTAQVAAGGRVMDPDLAGKWICYMHPEVVKDGPGACDVCDMPLVTTESLGYVPMREAEEGKPLVIPTSAPLITGKRAIVYVEVPKADKPTYEGREVVLGPRAGDLYIVREGLKENELVVVRGNFKIDSALQLEAKSSMMLPAGGTEEKPAAAPIEAPADFLKQLAAVRTAYGEVAAALAKDDFDAASKAAAETKRALDAVDMKLLAGEAHMTWMRLVADLRPPVESMTAATDIGALRKGFALFSDALARTFKTFIPTDTAVYVMHCPMAFGNRGANWLQLDPKARNPYFGAAMPSCGAPTETIGPAGRSKDE